MKKLVMIAIALGIATVPARTIPVTQEVDAEASASFGNPDTFYGALSPYGEWLELESGFYAWRPSHVGNSWRPYLHGRWAWTDYGWYWVSSEPFGWATFHYGRWYYDDAYGWVWVPDRTWGPAWVEWRYNDDYLGWAPLPPYASFGFNFGIRFTTRWFAPYHYWNFVRYGHMTSPYIYRDVVPLERARRLISTTRSAGRYDYEHGRIINRGIDREFVEHRGGFSRIDRIDVRDSHNMGERFVRDRSSNRIDVYRPNFNGDGRTHERFDARRIDRGTSLDLRKIERGRAPGPQHNDNGNVDRGRRAPGLGTREPSVPSSERKEIERRSEIRYPFPGRERAVRPQNNVERSTVIQKPDREDRQKIVTPHMINRGSRSAPEVRKTNPRGSEQGRREGSRRRN